MRAAATQEYSLVLEYSVLMRSMVVFLLANAAAGLSFFGACGAPDSGGDAQLPLSLWPGARGALRSAALLNTKVPPLDKSRWAPPPLRVLVGGSMPVVVISSISSEAECAANKKQKKQHTKSTAALLLLLQGARAHLRDGGVLRRLGLVGVRERLPSQRSAHGEVSRARPERGWACDAAVGVGGPRARTKGGRAARAEAHAEALGVAYLG